MDDTKYQDNQMKKYKLKDLVANGSRARTKVDSDVIVGDVKNGYGYGDILDANAVKEIIDQQASSGDSSYQELKDRMDSIDELDTEQQQRLDDLETKTDKLNAQVVDGNRLIITI